MPNPQTDNKTKTAWADVDDDEEEYETPVDEKTGIKQRIRTHINNKGQKVRTTTKIRVFEKKIRVPKRVLLRKNLPKFGDVADGESNVTILSRDFVSLEHPDDQLEESEDPALGSTLANFIIRQQERQLEREHDTEGLLDDSNLVDGLSKFNINDDDKEESKTGKYIPPSARGGAAAVSSDARSGAGRAGGLENAFRSSGSGGPSGSGGDTNHENTIRVSNLTKAVTEDDLRDLFGRFGRIHRVSLPRIERIENGKIIKEPRGFAYIAFYDHDEAEKAMGRLQGYGYDHLILKLEWAKPPTKDPNAPPSGGGLSSSYVSGYGQKLAQETKEQVLFASNLTGNR